MTPTILEGAALALVVKYIFDWRKRRSLAEWKAVEQFMATRDVNTFVEFLTENQPKFPPRVGYETLYSKSGRISVCHDIYGPEVKMDGGALIECDPSYYGITREEGQQIYNAILGINPTIIYPDISYQLMRSMFIASQGHIITQPKNRPIKDVYPIVDRLPNAGEALPNLGKEQ